MERDKDCLVHDRVVLDLAVWPRRRPIRDGRERTEEIRLKSMMQGFEKDDRRPDRWVFFGAPKGVFSSAWCRERIELARSLGKTFRNEWNNWIPGKDNIFIWRLTQGKIAVRQKLVEMKFNVPSVFCEICGEE